MAGGLATAVTLAIAWPLVLSPSELVYGHEIVGRHPDVHAVIFQLSEGLPSNLSAPPMTASVGWLIGRVVNAVAALNLLVLLTFPLTAIATYALARYLHGSHAAALIAALVFTFSPAHLAQAAYHPYTAQIQWIPLCFLALIAFVDKASIPRALALLIASLGLLLSNYDAALMCALLSPVVVVGFWAITPDPALDLKPLIWPGAVVALVFAAIAMTAVIRPALFAGASGYGLPIEEIALYRARWWAYFTPAVDHPVLGDLASEVFAQEGVNLQLLEEQLFIGYAFLALALTALAVAAWTWRPQWRYVVAVTAIGLAAGIISVGPTSGSCLPFSLAPACLVYHVVPAFRAYARFGIIVNLSVAIAAGAGAMILARHSRAGRIAATALLVLGVFEFWPMPARAHDVLPTAAHRWLVAHPDDGLALDCYPPNQDDRYVTWLMKRPLAFLDPTVPTCTDPELGRKLAALGYSQVIVRGGDAASKLLRPLPPGIALNREFPDSSVYNVATMLPPVLTIAAKGFYGYEHDAEGWWRWMGPQGQWTVRNTTTTSQRIALSVDLVPIAVPRTLSMTLDDAPAERVSLGMTRQPYVLGPWTLSPGDHIVTFAADGEPTRPSDVGDSKDVRPLTIAFRNESWIEPR